MMFMLLMNDDECIPSMARPAQVDCVIESCLYHYDIIEGIWRDEPRTSEEKKVKDNYCDGRWTYDVKNWRNTLIVKWSLTFGIMFLYSDEVVLVNNGDDVAWQAYIQIYFIWRLETTTRDYTISFTFTSSSKATYRWLLRVAVFGRRSQIILSPNFGWPSPRTCPIFEQRNLLVDVTLGRERSWSLFLSIHTASMSTRNKQVPHYTYCS